MAQLFHTGGILWISEIGCRETRVVLLSLEPGSRIWLDFEGSLIQFERMADAPDGSSVPGLTAVGPTAALWESLEAQRDVTLVEFEIAERPADRGRAGSGYYQRDEAA